MAKGNKIVINHNDARGRYLEGIISGTPKPGTVVQLKASTEPVSGRFTWEVYNRDADGDHPQGPLAVLREDELQGKLMTDAYVTGTRCFLYCPQNGDQLNMLVKNVSGTPDSFNIGDIMMVDDATGKLIATTGSPESEPFTMAETEATALTADELKHCFFTGY
jgi:hypothetical protein